MRRGDEVANMKIKSWRLTIYSIFMATLVLTMTCVFTIVAVESWLNSDTYLLSIFHKNREVFDRLKIVSMSDPNSGVCFGDPSIYYVKCSNESRLTYGKLLSQIPSRAHIHPDPPNGMWVLLASGGVSVVGPTWYKGFVYLTKDPRNLGELTSSLDRASGMPPGIYFRKIDEHWFLYYDRNTG